MARSHEGQCSFPTRRVPFFNRFPPLLTVVPESDDHDSIVAFGARAADFLLDVLCDQTHNFAPSSPARVLSPSSMSPVGRIRRSRQQCSNASIKLQIVNELWGIMRSVFPSDLLHTGGTKIVEGLAEDEECLTELDDTGDARTHWAYLCAEALLACDVDELIKFWARRARSLTFMPYEADVQSRVWRCFVEKWKADAEGTWEGAVVLLGVPFE